MRGAEQVLLFPQEEGYRDLTTTIDFVDRNVAYLNENKSGWKKMNEELR
ncbi:MAG: hypothetical protein AAB288_13875 [Acidobacteriota bacterium]